MAYCTANDVQALVNDTIGAEPLITLTELIIPSIEEYINVTVGHDFNLSDQEVSVDGKGTPAIRVPSRIVSIQSLKVSHAFGNEETLVENKDFVVYNPKSLEKYHADIKMRNNDTDFARVLYSDAGYYPLSRNVFPEGSKNVKISGRFGYEEVPKSIRFITAYMARAVYSDLILNGELKIPTSYSLGNFSVSHAINSSISKVASSEGMVYAILRRFQGWGFA
jgi:hypothetical protein